MKSGDNFRIYQNWLVDLILIQPYSYVAAFMGAGKTAIVLKALRLLLDSFRVRKVLIIAPLYVAEHTWPDEVSAWDFSDLLTFSVITGTEQERSAAALLDRDIHVVNRENLVWLYHFWGPDRWPYDMVVYDEATRLAQGTVKTATNRVSAFGVLSKMRAKIDRLVLLSGTPAAGGLQALWAPVYLLDQGYRLGATKKAFLDRWFDQNHYTHAIEPKPHALAEISSRLKGVMFALKEEDYIQLPPLVSNNIVIDLPPKAKQLYDRLERDMVIEELNVEAANQGVLTNKLLQLANGSLYNSVRDVQHIHDAKIAGLESVVEEALGEPILLAYSYQFDVAQILKKYPKARVFGQGKNDIKDWNAGRIRIMIMHPASAGHGLNIQFGGRIGCWFGMQWSLELYQQFIKRLHRPGQKGDRVFMHHILARGTADFDVLRAQARKDATQNAVTDAVRVRLEHVQRRAA